MPPRGRPRGSGKKTGKGRASPVAPSPPSSVIDGWASSGEELPEMVSSPVKVSPKKAKKRLDSPIEIIDSDSENKPPPKRKGKGRQVQASEEESDGRISPEYEIEPPEPKSAKGSRTKSPQKRTRGPTTPIASEDDDTPQTSPRKKRVAMMVPSTPTAVKNKALLAASPLGKGKVLFESVLLDRKPKKTNVVSDEEMDDDLKACEVTTADVELDSLLESTFGDLPYLKRSVSFPDGKINTLDFYALMNAIEKYKPNVDAFVSLVSMAVHTPKIINPSRADPRLYGTNIFSTKYPDPVLVDRNNQRMANFTFGVISKCQLLTSESWGGSTDGLESKSLQLFPLTHEIERMLAFADMRFGDGISITPYLGSLSFRTIPVNPIKAPKPPQSPSSFAAGESTQAAIASLIKPASRSRPSSQASTPVHVQISQTASPSALIQKVLSTRNSLFATENVPVLDARRYFLGKESKDLDFSLLDIDHLPAYDKDLEMGDLAGVIYTMSTYQGGGGPTYSFNVLAVLLFAGDYNRFQFSKKSPFNPSPFKGSPSKASSSKLHR